MRFGHHVPVLAALIVALASCGLEKTHNATEMKKEAMVQLVLKDKTWSLNKYYIDASALSATSLVSTRTNLTPGVCYEIRQPKGSITSQALSQVMGVEIQGGTIQIPYEKYALLTVDKVVGFIFVESTGTTQLQRWLLLNSYTDASLVPTTIQQAVKMDPVPSAGPQAPTTVADFTSRAASQFNAAKQGLADPCSDHTRYVKAKLEFKRIVDTPDAPARPYFPHMSLLLPFPTPPAPAPVPCASATSPGGQLDNGTVGLKLKGSSTMVGLVDESVAGDNGTSIWYLGPGYSDPGASSSNPPIVASDPAGSSATDYLGLSTDVDGVQRSWDVGVESTCYYRGTFPSPP